MDHKLSGKAEKSKTKRNEVETRKRVETSKINFQYVKLTNVGHFPLGKKIRLFQLRFSQSITEKSNTSAIGLQIIASKFINLLVFASTLLSLALGQP